MTITRKLNLAVGLIITGFVIVVALLSFVVVTIDGLRRIERDAIVVVRDVYRLGDEMKTLVSSNQPLPFLYNNWEEVLSQLDESMERFQESLAHPFLSEDLRERVDRAAQTWNVAQSSIEEVNEHIQSIIDSPKLPDYMKGGIATTAAAAQEAEGDLRSIVFTLSRIQRTLDTADAQAKMILADTLTTAAERLEGEIERFQMRMVAVAGGVTVAILVISFLAAVIFTRRLAARIRSIESAMGTVARKDMTVRVGRLGTDEVGNLGVHLDEVLTSLAGFFSEVKHAVENISELKDSMAAGTNESAAALNEITKNIESIKAQFLTLDENINNATDATGVVGSEISELATGIGGQAQALEQSSQAVSGINSALEDVVSLTEKNRSGARELLTVVKDGEERIGTTTELVRSISGEVDSILEVITVIQGIADQTNLLSMNAAIESAHAGEAGKGFAVVAEEIRKLADSSSDNSQQISRSLKAITERIQDALEASETGYRSYERISASVDVFVHAMEQIGDRMNSLSSSAGELEKSSGEIDRITREIREGSSQIDGKSQELSRAMETMSSISSHVVQGINEIDLGTREILEAFLSVSTATNESKERMESLEALMRSYRVSSSEEEPPSDGVAG